MTKDHGVEKNYSSLEVKLNQKDRPKVQYQCHICKKSCTRKRNLQRHVKKAHPGISTETESNHDIDKKFVIFHKSVTPVDNDQCNICHRNFSSKLSLTRHMEKFHKTDDSQQDKVTKRWLIGVNMFKKDQLTVEKWMKQENNLDKMMSGSESLSLDVDDTVTNKDDDIDKDISTDTNYVIDDMECSDDKSFDLNDRRNDMACDIQKDNDTMSNDSDIPNISYEEKEACINDIVERIKADPTMLTGSNNDMRFDRTSLKGRFHCDVCDKTFALKRTLKAHKIFNHSKMSQGQPSVLNNVVTTTTPISDNVSDNVSDIKKESDNTTPPTMDTDNTVTDQQLPQDNDEDRNDIKDCKNADGKFTCDMCTEEFDTRNAIGVHRAKVHLGKSACICDICGKGFWGKKNLKMHQKIHDKDTGRNTDMKKYKSVNSGGRKKKYKCIQSKVTFPSKGDVNKPRDNCDFDSSLNETTPVSVKVSDNDINVTKCGPRPDRHGCDICPEKFKTRNARAIHKAKIHTGGPIYPCDICGKEFTYKHNKYAHMRNVHKNSDKRVVKT